MQLTIAKPAPALSRFLLTYYLVEDETSITEDIQRADVGGFTFVLEGSGHYDFGRGKRILTTATMLNGPTTSCVSFSAFGPLRFVGASPQPDFWGGLVDADAARFANTMTDPTPFLSRDPAPTLDLLRTCRTVDEMAPILDAYFLSLAKPLPHDQIRNIELIRRWLSAPIPKVSELYAQSKLTERQMIRIANRFFGAPPKALARKYAALRTATAICWGDEEVAKTMVAHFADQSHFIREVKNVCGQTPRQLKSLSRPLLRMTLHPSMYRELVEPG